MKKEELDIIINYFEPYLTGIYNDIYSIEPAKTGTKYFHKNGCDFHIIIFEDGELYQLNTDHEKFGIELLTMEDLEIRFKSFTGEEITNLEID